jgi:hypothetical protein
MGIDRKNTAIADERVAVAKANVRVQTCFTNSTEVLFAVIAFYQLRVVERLWGSRKFAVSSLALSNSVYILLTFICSPSYS